MHNFQISGFSVYTIQTGAVANAVNNAIAQYKALNPPPAPVG